MGKERSRGPCPAACAVVDAMSWVKGDTVARVSLQEGKQRSCAGGRQLSPLQVCAAL